MTVSAPAEREEVLSGNGFITMLNHSADASLQTVARKRLDLRPGEPKPLNGLTIARIRLEAAPEARLGTITNKLAELSKRIVDLEAQIAAQRHGRPIAAAAMQKRLSSLKRSCQILSRHLSA